MGLLPMDADILPPSDDRVFKLILTSPQAKPVLTDLISAIIERTVTDVVVRNNEIPVEDTQEKAGEHKNLKGKSIYYLCDLHSSQPSKGLKRYDKLAQTYQVTFCSYTVFPNRREFVNSFSMRHDEDNELLTDAIRVIYLELSKLDKILKKPVNDMTDLEKWAVFFRYANMPTQRETVNKIIESKEALQMAGDLLLSVTQDERDRAKARSRRMFLTDMQSDLATAEDQGEKRGRLAIARNLIKMNMPLEQIVTATDLTHEEVENLINET